jgi:hypothetical protein
MSTDLIDTSVFYDERKKRVIFYLLIVYIFISTLSFFGKRERIITSLKTKKIVLKCQWGLHEIL